MPKLGDWVSVPGDLLGVFLTKYKGTMSDRELCKVWVEAWDKPIIYWLDEVKCV